MRMIPPVVSRSTNSLAERRLFSRLQAVELPRATCYHSLQLSNHDYKRAGEIDFLLVTESGVLVLEVKGGRVSQEDGIWHYTDRFDHVHRSSEGPFQQAASAMFSLERSLRASVGPEVGGLVFGYAVVLPDIDFRQESVEWDPADVWDRASVETPTGLKRAFQRSMASWRRRSPARTGTIDRELAADLGRALRPDFDRVPSLRVRAAELDAAMEELTESQYAALDLLRSCDRVLFEGGAGTGKTFLAVETARRESVERPTLLVASSPLFASYLASRLADTTVDVHAVSELAGSSARWDALVVDEAQDLMNMDDLGVLDSVVRGGLEEGRWRIFHDPNGQRDLVGRFDPDAWEFLRSTGAVPAALDRNCRNTEEIVIQTRLYTAADVGKPTAGRGPAVEFLTADRTQEADALDRVLRELLAEDYRPGDITVLTAGLSVEGSAVAETKAYRKGRLRSLREAVSTDWPTTDVTCASIAEFKGFENLVIVLSDVGRLPKDQQLPSLYVGMTRARVQLIILLDEEAKAELAERASLNMREVEGLLDVVR